GDERLDVGVLLDLLRVGYVGAHRDRTRGRVDALAALGRQDRLLEEFPREVGVLRLRPDGEALASRVYLALAAGWRGEPRRAVAEVGFLDVAELPVAIERERVLARHELLPGGV